MIKAGVAIFLLFVLYLLLVGSAHIDEIIAGLLSAIAAAAASLAMSHVAERHFDLHDIRWSRSIARSLWSIIVDVPRVGLHFAVSTSPGFVQCWHIRANNNSSVDAARRALITLAASLAPNGYVLKIDAERGEMRVHRLAPAAPPENPEWPL